MIAPRAVGGSSNVTSLNVYTTDAMVDELVVRTALSSSNLMVSQKLKAVYCIIFGIEKSKISNVAVLESSMHQQQTNGFINCLKIERYNSYFEQISMIPSIQAISERLRIIEKPARIVFLLSLRMIN